VDWTKREEILLRQVPEPAQMRFTPDGRHLLTLAKDGRFAAYYVDPADLATALMGGSREPLTDEECKEHFHVRNCKALPKPSRSTALHKP
jgi:hypothetical protein